MSSTFSPRSRKCSATHIAVFGARRRIIGLSSPVATTAMRARLLAAERVLQELAHLAAALADEGEDGRVEARGARQHGEQRGLADAGAGEDADALPGAQRREEVDDA